MAVVKLPDFDTFYEEKENLLKDSVTKEIAEFIWNSAISAMVYEIYPILIENIKLNQAKPDKSGQQAPEHP